MRKNTLKRGLGVLLSLILLFGMVPVMASAATNILPSTATFTELGVALSAANSGDTVHITADYTLTPGDSITVPAGVTLTGDAGKKLTLTGAFTGSGVISLGAGAKLEGLIIDAMGATPASSMYAVFPIADGATITGCTFLGDYSSNPNYNMIAIGVGGGSTAINSFTISGNTFDGVRQPVNVNFAPPDAGNASARIISGNTISNTKGIVVYNTSLVTISGNTYGTSGANTVDIALLGRVDGTGINASKYTTNDVIALSDAENCLVDMQTPGTITHNYFNNGVIDTSPADSNTNANVLQFAIDNAKDGAVIKLPAGTYEIDKTIVIDKDNVSIIGVGAVTIQPSAGFAAQSANGMYSFLLSVSKDSTALRTTGFTLENITFDALNQTVVMGAAGQKPIGEINLYNVSGAVITNCTASNGKLGLALNGSTATITGFTTSGNTWGGINLGQGTGITAAPGLTISGKYNFGETPAIYDDTAAKVGTVTGNGWTVDANGVWTYTAPTPPYYPYTPTTTTPTVTIEEEGPPLADVEFTDIEEHWAEDYITALAERGFITGLDGDPLTYGPDVKITRADFVQFLANIFAENLDEYTGETKFKDVDADADYAKAAEWAAEMGIVKGISLDEFGPELEITREQLVTMILRAVIKFEIELTDEDGELFPDDAQISDYAREAVYALRAAGIIDGKDTGDFDPQNSITRAEVAKILSVLLSDYTDLMGTAEDAADEAAE